MHVSLKRRWYASARSCSRYILFSEGHNSPLGRPRDDGDLSLENKPLMRPKTDLYAMTTTTKSEVLTMVSCYILVHVSIDVIRGLNERTWGENKEEII